MNVISIIMAVFSVLAAIDLIFGSRFGLGKEFEKGFMLFGTMALSMIGMIVISPFIADVMHPLFDFVYKIFKIDPSIIPAIFFANDMGGAPLATSICKDTALGGFNALVVSSMMGATISFTIPFALGLVKKEKHRWLLLGLLCGIVTIPIGCFVSGLVLSIPLIPLLIDLLPIIIFSVIIAFGLIKFPSLCVKIFSIFGVFIKTIIIIGLSLSLIKFLTGFEVINGLATLEEGAAVCLNASAVMTGAFPLMLIVSKLLKKPLSKLGSKLSISELSAVGFVSSLATSATTFGVMNDMDDKGTMLNSAFAVSGAFTFAGHLAFTLAFNADYIVPVIIGKLVSGLFAIVVAAIIFKRVSKAA